MKMVFKGEKGAGNLNECVQSQQISKYYHNVIKSIIIIHHNASISINAVKRQTDEGIVPDLRGADLLSERCHREQTKLINIIWSRTKRGKWDSSRKIP